MKQRLINLIWPSLVGALAAALILDNWLLNDSPDPRSVAVKTYNTAVSKATPSVVNIYTAKLVLNNREPNLNSPLLKQLRFSHQGRRSVERSLGSGVILTEAGHIVTNNHVIRGADAIQVLLADGRSANALVVGEDPETDLAVLKIELPDLVPITVANSNDLLVGDVVLAIGNPFGFGHSVSQGIVSGVGRFGLQQTTYEAYIQTDATVHHGSSGGALINTKGGLVGINTLIYTAGGEADGITFGIGINLATPSELAEHVLKDVIKYGRVVRGWLGVSVEVLVVKGNNGRPFQRLVVTGLTSNGPAQRAGFRLNDIIVAMDGDPVIDGRKAMMQIARLRPGHLLKVSLERLGKEIETEAIVGTRKPSS